MPTTFPIKRSDVVRTAFDVVVDIPLSDLEDDPYPFYEWMRRECPVAYVPESGRVWLLTWDLCKEHGVNDAVFGPTKDAHEGVYGRPNLMALTGDAHRTLRNAANAPTRPRKVKGYYETGIRATSRSYLSAIVRRGSADATLDIFEPIAQRVVGDVLGFPDVDDATLGRWFHVLADYLVDYGRDPQVAERSQEVKAEVREHVAERLPDLVAHRDETALSHMLHDGLPDGEVRDLDQILPTVYTLIVGGLQEPAHLIASTLYGLLTNPSQLQQVLDDPSRTVRAAVEEGLRWLPPFGYTEKLTTQDVSVGGIIVPANTEIAMVIGSANRDPLRFENPNQFDINRTDQDNVTFGFGAHFCIGHHLARALGEVALEETLSTLPDLRLDPANPTVISGWQTRAPKHMPVLWGVPEPSTSGERGNQ
jgi:cytochrome P450